MGLFCLRIVSIHIRWWTIQDIRSLFKGIWYNCLYEKMDHPHSLPHHRPPHLGRAWSWYFWHTICWQLNMIIRTLYKTIAKPIFFQMDPERVHDMMISLGSWLGRHNITRGLTKALFHYKHKVLEQTIAGIDFANPLGLAAGFDKNAQIIDIMAPVGFGHTEVGSITGEPCEGNPKPRLWRLPKSKGLVVYYGLKNDGSEAIAKRLHGRTFDLPVGISIAKANCKATADRDAGIEDYTTAFERLKDCGAYVTINISCPNAFGGQPFSNPNDLDALLTRLEQIPCEKPIFLKLPPDLDEAALDMLIGVCDDHRIDGFICTNLTKDRENKAIGQHLKDADIPDVGGISGLPVRDLATETISHIYKKTEGKYVIIGCGGVASAKDAYEKIKAGASLVQLITGMIYEGPQLIGEINAGLVKLLKADGYGSISEAVGANHEKENHN